MTRLAACFLELVRGCGADTQPPVLQSQGHATLCTERTADQGRSRRNLSNSTLARLQALACCTRSPQDSKPSSTCVVHCHSPEAHHAIVDQHRIPPRANAQALVCQIQLCADRLRARGREPLCPAAEHVQVWKHRCTERRSPRGSRGFAPRSPAEHKASAGHAVVHALMVLHTIN